VVGQPDPFEGMGATLLAWTDRHAATIVAVRKMTGGRWFLIVREDKAIVISGSAHNGSAEYRYEANPRGTEHSFRGDADGTWHEVAFNPETNRWKKTGGYGLRIGERAEYRDPSF